MIILAISPVICRICCMAGWSLELATFPDKIMQPDELAGFDEGPGIGRFRRGRLMFAFIKCSNMYVLIADSLIHSFYPKNKSLSLKILPTITHAPKPCAFGRVRKWNLISLFKLHLNLRFTHPEIHSHPQGGLD